MSDASKLHFRSVQGFSVWSCACGCDCQVKVSFLMESEATSDRFYIAHHAPLGCSYEHKGAAYEDSREPLPPAEASTHTDAPPPIEKLNSEPPRPFTARVLDLEDDEYPWSAELTVHSRDIDFGDDT